MGCTTSNSVVTQESMQQNSNLTPEEIRLVKESWSIVGKDLTDLGPLVFKKFFETQQGIIVLFERLMSAKSDGPVNFHYDRLSTHATIVMESLGAAVECLGDSKNSTNLLINMGKRHAKYNVHPDMIPFLFSSQFTILCGKAPKNLTAFPIEWNEVEKGWNGVELSGVGWSGVELGGVYFWPAMREALKELLQEQFTRELEESWCNVFEYITCKFQQGIKQGQQLMR
ncbi:hypothetical protein KUTeg_024441 [Tegillarca granosa]|uniref:Globin domain-containing protein n=1 Tax=Tegillarca granosa TaxID=220873 RepID=A0ABQ9E332_TEGGR|nr:hypothetical protein KUTeg_024441 [Tegillarca granosa]